MMRYLNKLFRIAALAALSPFLHLAASSQTAVSLSVEDMRSDLSTLRSIIEQSHPNLYRSSDKSSVERRWLSAQKALKKPMSTIEFLNFVSPLINQYNDAHTSMDLPFEDEAFKSYIKNDGRFFPFQVMIDGDRLYITGSLGNTTLAPGTEIIAIGKRSAKQVLSELRPIVMGDSPAGRDSALQRLFALYVWQMYDNAKDFELKIRLPRNSAANVTKATVAGIDYDLLSKVMFGDEPVRSYELTPDVLVLEINKMQSNDNVKKAIDDAFAKLKEKNYPYLVIDLRKNGGGNSVVGEWALNYLTRRTFNQGGTKEVRISQYLLDNNKFYSGWIPKLKERFPVEGDRLVMKYEGDSDQLDTDKWVYAGKTIMLTSPRTYSSGFMMAEAFSCYKVGRIVGEAPGSYRNLTGELMQFSLPNSKLIGYVAAA
ncbi:MAG TPA: S41 family peptidase, partial [Pyrinomonadaceae bacterium]|nr:S41 family peptidase [Pyrinomonadaceae bacterium]